MDNSANSPDSVASLLGLPMAYFIYSRCYSFVKAMVKQQLLWENPSLVQQIDIDHLACFRSRGAGPRLQGYKSSWWVIHIMQEAGLTPEEKREKRGS